MPIFRALAPPSPPSHLSDDYLAYLASPEWAERRERILARNGWACEWCMERLATDLHHLTYARFGHEWDADLLALCRPCHRRADALRAGFTNWARWRFGRLWHYEALERWSAWVAQAEAREEGR